MKRIVRFVNQFEEWTLVGILMSLAFLTAVQVFCRYVLQFSFPWMEELNRYVGVFIAFLGASLGVKYGSHFSMDLIYERVTSDRLRHGLKVLINVICAALFVLVAYYGYVQTMKLKQFGTLTPALQLPKYWAYVPIPFFSVIMSLRFLIAAFRHLKGLVKNERFTLVPGEKP